MEARLRTSVRGSRRVALVTHAVLIVVMVLFTDLAHVRMQRLFRPDWGKALPAIDRAFAAYLVALVVLAGVDAVWWRRALALRRRSGAAGRAPALLRGAVNATLWLLMFVVGLNFAPLYDGAGVRNAYLGWGLVVQLLLILASFSALCGLLLACAVTAFRPRRRAGGSGGSHWRRPARGARGYRPLAYVVMTLALAVECALVYPPGHFEAHPPGPAAPGLGEYALLALGLVAAVVVIVAGYRADHAEQS